MIPIEACDLELAYDEKTIVSDLALRLEAGEIAALVGPNGSGKSTTLRALARLLKPRAGTVYLDGQQITQMGTKEVARRLALLPQSPEIPAGVTVRELVGYGRYPYQGLLSIQREEDRQAVEWAIEVTALNPLADRMVDTLSGGERQRAWIAMALAQQSDVLLLDEPTTYLDIRHQQELLSLVKRLNRQHGITVGWVLHDLNQAAAYSDRMFLFDDGQLVASGKPTEVMQAETIRQVFGIDVTVIPHPRSAHPLCLPIEPDSVMEDEVALPELSPETPLEELKIA